ncbi:MAG: tRNA pseudouridine(55) synthase TruB [Clostridia bacterium]|nr:tRNA pseudouridine(55) synthase TruB [Clostridia bacterium]
MDGMVLINKEKGISSFGVVSRIRKIYGVKKVGHTGTLDPEAEGVLPILIGEATKLSKFFIEHDKKYRATLKLGIKTDSGDEEGNVVTEDGFVLNRENEEEYRNIISTFIGKQKQIPPMYSALKVNGKKLYEYAREGIEIERKERDIEIYSIEIVEFNYSKNCIVLDVECSKGTYIRTLCEDIAEKIGTVGFMKKLVRTKVNSFTIENSVTIGEIEKSSDNLKCIISIEKLFMNKKEIVLDNEKNRLFINGGRIKIIDSDDIYRVYCNDKFIGLGKIESNILKREIVIN